MINDVGFENQVNNAGELATAKRKIKTANEIHLKFVDDLTVAEAVKMKQDLTNIPPELRPLPDAYHSRTGHILPESKSKVYSQLKKTQLYYKENQMKINFKKTKMMLFNPSKTLDFMPQFCMEGHEIELISETRLLGLHISSDLKWKKNTRNMVLKASRRLWMLRRLCHLGASTNSLKEVYTKQIRSVLEFGVPVWQGSITQSERVDIERVQKCAVNIILGRKYFGYEDALKTLNLEYLEARRVRLCLNFALKAEKHHKFSKWFQKPVKKYNTRNKKKYIEIHSNHSRYTHSPLGYLTRLLYMHYNTK